MDKQDIFICTIIWGDKESITVSWGYELGGVSGGP
jgi:hypothetical protein